MSRFIAIPVAVGDAFYLELDNFSILTDGGGNTTAFPTMFQTCTKTNGVNIVICTHNDADHANGILGFLQAGMRCEEVWLPGRWLSVLPDILKPFVEILEELISDIKKIRTSDKLEKYKLIFSNIEDYANYVSDSLRDDPLAEEGPLVEDDGWPKSCIEKLENAELLEDIFQSFEPRGLAYWVFRLTSPYFQLMPAEVQLLWSAIDAARIRGIALEAFHRGISVRWFEFNTSHPSGGIPTLQPVNSREVGRVRPRVGPLLTWLALTVSNKESLVFLSPAGNNYPGILFTADSNLSGLQIPFQLDHALITASHHGSEANAMAYSFIESVSQNAFSSITWVRSDGRYKSRPGRTYLGLTSSKICSLCRQAGGKWTRKQAIHLYSRSGKWIRTRGSKVCSCQ